MTDLSLSKSHTNCRVCGSSRLVKYLDLGMMPLANNLESSAQEAKDQDRFPLEVMFCQGCGLSQLSVVVNPEKLFSFYTYHSSVNEGCIKHFRQMAKELRHEYDLDENSFIVDIASNDGCLLKEFKEEIGLKVLGVDPAKNLVEIAKGKGIETLPCFWDTIVASKIAHNYGKADIITACNVFAHVDDLGEFIAAIKILLADDGKFIIEMPYLVDFIEKVEYDTIYFEHLSYFSVIPIIRLCSGRGLQVSKIEKQEIHGGTIRVTITHDGHIVNPSVEEYYDRELDNGYHHISKYEQWSKVVKERINGFTEGIEILSGNGAKIAGFAASAKGNTLLNSCDIGVNEVKFICDDSPDKIGKFSPGTAIPIVSSNELSTADIDYLIILSWNFEKELISKAKTKGFKGKFIIPVPEFKIIEG